MVIIFLADGFELVEALTPLDMLKRAGYEVLTASIKKDKEVKSSCGVRVIADASVSDLGNMDIEAVVLPGGMPGAKNLSECEFVRSTVIKAESEGKIIGAICAAPFILGEMGLLKGKEAICFPGFEDKLVGAVLSDKKVIRDGNIITAMGMGVALRFSYELIKALGGEEKANKILTSVMA